MTFRKWVKVAILRSLTLLHLLIFMPAQSPEEKLIMYGEPLKIESMPYLAAIVMFSQWPKNITICTGSLIDDRWVLTAAHCGRKLPKKNGYIKVRLGIDRYSQEGPVSNVKWRICHELYHEDYLTADICLLQTFDQIPFSDCVQPAALPMGCEMSECITGMRVAGWGQTEKERGRPLYASAVDLVMVDDAECDRHLAIDLSKEKPGSYFCAGTVTKAGKSPCYGDSGAAAVLLRSDNKTWTAMGVVARGLHCKGLTVFISVTYFLDWITETMWHYY